ncbi:SMP-30/gluconolactonase/LRE family protein [Akkermansiaceae bacterium]|nr:SMP-30/gluconolactonase/LRE family protein [Akkermansiaceae bacterium]MDB4272586.1 SMP-30/gluconolactonase/LRE family protein [bacterium]MDB4294484.1 SMP-30/gluconolactonase/LRE family protein [Akkermansiaceae bacterium]MDB4332737.1 SMP-30/gluconolactonase/LRE family protein [Akkermansiaceae bacterium]MDB4614953.1 SMP-30/gluconolactonase/LRE family protein [Akkermansiaceae bacterium]
MKVDLVGNYRAQWGEGPIWWQGRLVYVDIEKHCVISVDPETGAEKKFEVGQRVGTVVPRKKGGFVIAGDDGFFFLDPEGGGLTKIADPEPDKDDNRFNDGKCSPDGHFFAGTISLVKKEGDAKLYRLSPELEVAEAFGPVTNSNGIVWSADGSLLYYIDTPRKAVLCFDYVAGEMSNPREVISTSNMESSPDGMAIDENGHLWVAFCHGSCVICYDPASGDELKRVDLPCMETTACAFGGGNLDELYVTTGIHKSEVEEDAGRLFRITGLGVRGLPSHAFAG